MSSIYATKHFTNQSITNILNLYAEHGSRLSTHYSRVALLIINQQFSKLFQFCKIRMKRERKRGFSLQLSPYEFTSLRIRFNFQEKRNNNVHNKRYNYESSKLSYVTWREKFFFFFFFTEKYEQRQMFFLRNVCNYKFTVTRLNGVSVTHNETSKRPTTDLAIDRCVSSVFTRDTFFSPPIFQTRNLSTKF